MCAIFSLLSRIQYMSSLSVFNIVSWRRSSTNQKDVLSLRLRRLRHQAHKELYAYKQVSTKVTNKHTHTQRNWFSDSSRIMLIKAFWKNTFWISERSLVQLGGKKSGPQFAGASMLLNSPQGYLKGVKKGINMTHMSFDYVIPA